MSYRCVIVDDELPARKRLERLLADHPDFEIAGQAADATAAVRLIDEWRAGTQELKWHWFITNR